MQVQAALDRLTGLPRSRLVAASPLYRSAPFGGVEQPDFVNAAASLVTRLSPEELLAELKRIEREQGREKDAARWGPRVLDLDLLVYSRRKIDTKILTVPHPGISERNFVLLPLMEIAPDLYIPGLGRVADIEVHATEPAISKIGPN